MGPRTRPQTWPLLLSALLASTLPGPPAAATSLLDYGTEKLLQDCAFVVTGTVESAECAYHDALYGSGKHEIYTFTTIRVDRAFKQAGTGTTLVLEEIGGSIPPKHSIVDGIPRFSPGEEVLVFVERRLDGHLKTLGMIQGAFRIERSAGDPVLVPFLPGRDTRIVPSEFGADLIPPDRDGRFALPAFLEAIEARTQDGREGSER